MDFNTLRMELYAIESIAPDQEISIEYLPGFLSLTRAERSAALFESFGFRNCLCPLCTASEELGAESDKRRLRLKKIIEELTGEADRATKMGWLEEIRELLVEEKYIGPPEFCAYFPNRYRPGADSAMVFSGSRSLDDVRDVPPDDISSSSSGRRIE